MCPEIDDPHGSGYVLPTYRRHSSEILPGTGPWALPLIGWSRVVKVVRPVGRSQSSGS